MSQHYPPQPGPGWGTPPKKNPTGKIIGFGCLGIVALFLLIGIIAAVAGGDSTSDESTSTAPSSSATAPAEKDNATPQPAESKAAPKTPVKVTAEKTAFAKTVLADGTNYTSVKITISNGSNDTININPLYFTVTDTGGTKHTAELGVDKNQLDTVDLAPGENISGVITVKGKVTPKYVTYTDGFLGDPVRADVP